MLRDLGLQIPFWGYRPHSKLLKPSRRNFYGQGLEQFHVEREVRDYCNVDPRLITTSFRGRNTRIRIQGKRFMNKGSGIWEMPISQTRVSFSPEKDSSDFKQLEPHSLPPLQRQHV